MKKVEMTPVQKRQLVLVTATGQDKPGITSALTLCIKNNSCRIEDMGQSIIHGLLSLSFLLDVGDEHPDPHDHNVFKDLLFSAKKMGMQLDFKVIEDKDLSRAEGDQYILNCVKLSGISAGFVHDIATALAGHKFNIQRIENIQKGQFVALEMTAIAPAGNLDWARVKTELMKISNDHATDMALLKDNVWRRNKRLIVFDMDSTLIQNEVIDEMAREYGVYDQVHAITEKAMNGEFDFNQSLQHRVEMLKGMPEQKLHEILSRLELTLGVEDFIHTVKTLGYKVAIISGGFTFFANHFMQKLGLHFAFANQLEIAEGKLTGKVLGEIVNAEGKARLLEQLARQEGIKLEQVVAVGDGANDLPMLAKAGLGIAFHAKEIVKKSAGQHLSHGPMTTILYFLGIPGALRGDV